MPRRKNNHFTTNTVNPEKASVVNPTTNLPVDISSEKLYTLSRLLEQSAPLLSFLENCKSLPPDGLESERKGVSDMSKRLKQRVKIGVNEAGEPIYKWADGYSIEELNDNIVRIYIENGLLARFSGNSPMGRKIDRHKACPTFEEYTREWFETFKAPNLKPTTCSGYRSNLTKHIYPFFGKMRLDEITTEDIQRFLNEKESLARNTVHTMFVLLGEALESAYEDKLIPVDPSKSKRLSITSKGKTERDALRPEQLRSIIRAMSSASLSDDERRLLALFIFTGMRRGEVLGLKWEDVDFKKKLIHVQRNVTYPHNQPIITTTKTKSGKRAIPLDDRLTEFLKPIGAEGYILGGDQPITNMVFRRLYDSIEKQIDFFGATPHVFRHSYITNLARADIDLKTIQRISGHANISTTLNIYTHSHEEEVQAAGEKLGRLLGA